MEIKSKCKKCLRFLKNDQINSSYRGFCLTTLSIYVFTNMFLTTVRYHNHPNLQIIYHPEVS
jgi:hypothetical protein